MISTHRLKMKEVLFYFIISGITFLSGLTLVIIGIISAKNKMLIPGVTLFLIGIGTGGTAIYKTMSKATDMLEPRSGKEIYMALFGKPAADCLKIIHFQDQVIPKIDYAIWLHVETCPEEVDRILLQRNYTHTTIASEEVSTSQPEANQKWFTPEVMGDSIELFRALDEYGNGQEVYCNKDYTEMFIIDILD